MSLFDFGLPSPLWTAYVFAVKARTDTAMEKDIQELIPEAHRDLIEAVPKGFSQSSAIGGLLLGGLLGAIACMLVANWMIPIVFGALLIAQRIWVWRNDKGFDKRVEELKERGLAWEIEDAT